MQEKEISATQFGQGKREGICKTGWVFGGKKRSLDQEEESTDANRSGSWFLKQKYQNKGGMPDLLPRLCTNITNGW
jgi:hypothetical protein